MDIGSKQVAAAAIKMALTADREEEHRMRQLLAEEGFRTAAVDFGGDFITSIKKVIERAMVAATREGVISERHLEQGALAGAAREAVAQIMNKAVGMSVGGKIGIARHSDHVAVAIFFGIGMLHLNEVSIGLGHRAI